jgi:hypothetical protein
VEFELASRVCGAREAPWTLVRPLLTAHENAPLLVVPGHSGCTVLDDLFHPLWGLEQTVVDAFPQLCVLRI